MAAIPALKRSGIGRIVNIGSVSVRITQLGLCAYNASKHALAGKTFSLAVELGRYGASANILHPGTVHTSMTDDLLADADMRRRLGSIGTVGRVWEADEIVHAALYLADGHAG